MIDGKVILLSFDSEDTRFEVFVVDNERIDMFNREVCRVGRLSAVAAVAVAALAASLWQAEETVVATARLR